MLDVCAAPFLAFGEKSVERKQCAAHRYWMTSTLLLLILRSHAPTQAAGLAWNQMSVRRRLRRHPITHTCTRTRISQDRSLTCSTRVTLNVERANNLLVIFFILFSCFSSFGRSGQLYIRCARRQRCLCWVYVKPFFFLWSEFRASRLVSLYWHSVRHASCIRTIMWSRICNLSVLYLSQAEKRQTIHHLSTVNATNLICWQRRRQQLQISKRYGGWNARAHRIDETDTWCSCSS